MTIVEFLQGWPGDAISFISLQSRFEPFARGLIDSRAVIYFLSLTVLGLVVAFRSLESRKWLSFEAKWPWNVRRRRRPRAELSSSSSR